MCVVLEETCRFAQKLSFSLPEKAVTFFWGDDKQQKTSRDKSGSESEQPWFDTIMKLSMDFDFVAAVAKAARVTRDRRSQHRSNKVLQYGGLQKTLSPPGLEVCLALLGG